MKTTTVCDESRQRRERVRNELTRLQETHNALYRVGQKVTITFNYVNIMSYELQNTTYCLN